MERRYRIAVWAVSASVGLAVILTPLFSGLYIPQRPYIVPLTQKANNVIASGLLLILIFPSIVEFNNYRWGKQIDKNVPRLLRDITEAVRSGITLPRALEDASKRDYGPLSKELEHTASIFILGAGWQDSLMSLAQHLRRTSVLRLSAILNEAHQTGGRMLDVLDASVDLTSSLNEYREEQRNNMRPYATTIYMATIIFLIISYVVLHQFLLPLYQASTSTMFQSSGLLTGVLDINYYSSILFWASIIESIFSGLIIGKIEEKTLSAGLPHSALLCIVTILFFNFSSV